MAQAAAHLRAGRLVAFPTETVYGLGADATNGLAVAGIFEVKGRPRFNPLIVHVADLAAAERLGVFNALARRLAEAIWPGPLTLVVAKQPSCAIADLATAGLETVALRVPAHPIALALIRAAGCPVAAPSANRSGHVSPTRAAHVLADLGDRPAMILDGGATGVGVESTVADASGAVLRLLRPGGLTAEDIERVTGTPLIRATHDADAIESDGDPAPASPGLLASHYAPRARVRLNAVATQPGEAMLAFGPTTAAHAGPLINLSAAGDLHEAAVNLFAALRDLDATGAAAIAVMPIPSHGLGEAINDRLRRAAAGR